MVYAINKWIAGGCNYQVGVSLYQQYGSSNFLKSVFKKAETAVNRQKLNVELVALRDKAPAPVASLKQVITEITQAKTAITNQPAPDQQNLQQQKTDLNTAVSDTQTATGKQLLDVIRQREDSYAEIRTLKPLLTTEPEGESLRAIAERIVRLGKKNAELWVRYNHLTENTGQPDQVEAPLPPPVMIDISLINKRELIRKALSKAKQRLKSQAKPKPNTLALIAQKELELKEIDELIASIKNGGAK